MPLMTKDGMEIKNGMIIWRIAIRERHCTIMALTVNDLEPYKDDELAIIENSFSTKQAAIKDTIEHLEAIILHLKEKFYD